MKNQKEKSNNIKGLTDTELIAKYENGKVDLANLLKTVLKKPFVRKKKRDN